MERECLAARNAPSNVACDDVFAGTSAAAWPARTGGCTALLSRCTLRHVLFAACGGTMCQGSAAQTFQQHRHRGARTNVVDPGVGRQQRSARIHAAIDHQFARRRVAGRVPKPRRRHSRRAVANRAVPAFRSVFLVIAHGAAPVAQRRRRRHRRGRRGLGGVQPHVRGRKATVRKHAAEHHRCAAASQRRGSAHARQRL